jgi:hypothetical protein
MLAGADLAKQADMSLFSGASAAKVLNNSIMRNGTAEHGLAGA